MFMHDVLGKLKIHQAGPSLRRILGKRADGVLEVAMRCDFAVGNVEMHGAIPQSCRLDHASHSLDVRHGIKRAHINSAVAIRVIRVSSRPDQARVSIS